MVALTLSLNSHAYCGPDSKRAANLKQSKLDLCSGYHQLSLTPESRCITTFATHDGLRRYEVEFEQIHDIARAINISDDIIVFGMTP